MAAVNKFNISYRKIRHESKFFKHSCITDLVECRCPFAPVLDAGIADGMPFRVLRIGILVSSEPAARSHPAGCLMSGRDDLRVVRPSPPIVASPLAEASHFMGRDDLRVVRTSVVLGRDDLRVVRIST